MLTLTVALLVSQWPSISTELPRAGGGENDVAVIVGASDYVFLPDIDGATANADDWFTWLARVRGVPLERITILKDREVTREKLERALTSAASASRSNGLVWFVFIGHGAPAPGGDDGVLLGVDTQPDLESLGARGITQKQVLAALGRGKQQDGVVVFDACFSGRAPDGNAPLVPGMQATVPVRRAAQVAPKLARTTTLSASETFAGPLPGANRPAFSYALLGALRGWGDDDGDRNVTLDEAYRSARGTLQVAFKSDARLPQKNGDGAFVVAKNTSEKAPDLVAAVLGTSGTPSASAPTAAAARPMPTTVPELFAALSAAIAAKAPVDTQLELHARLGEAVLHEARRAAKAGDDAGYATHSARAEKNFLRAVELWSASSKRGVVEEMTAMSEFHLAELELPRAIRQAPSARDWATLREELKNMDLLLRPIFARLDRAASGYASKAWAVQALFGKGAVLEIAVKLYGGTACAKELTPQQCTALRTHLETSVKTLQVSALASYEAAVKLSDELGVNSEEARMARMSVARLRAR